MQPNVLAERSPFRNTVKDGVLQPPDKSGFVSDLMRQSQNNDATRDRVSLPLYQPVYLTGVGFDGNKLILAHESEGRYAEQDRRLGATGDLGV